MNPYFPRLASLAAVLALASSPALAVSFASSASEGASASVGSISESFETSSEGSSKRETAAAGQYHIIEVADAADRPGMVRMKLQPVADAAGAKPFNLYVPAQTIEQGQLAAGQMVAVRDRPYGTEFAKVDTGRAFFLVLNDESYRELQSRALTL
jgi:hypothetical protein